MKRYLIIMLLLSSCVSINITTEERNQLVPLSIKDMEHQSFVLGDNFELAPYVFGLDFTNTEDIIHDTLTIRWLNKKAIELSLKTQNQILSRRLRGRTINNQFTFKNQLKFSGPAPPLLWVFGSESNALYKDLNDNLVILHNHGGCIMVGILPIFGTSVGQGKYTLNLVKE